MNTRDCIAWCVTVIGIVSLVVALTFIAKFSGHVSELTEAISQPGITSNITIDELIIASPDDVKIEIRGFDAQVNSRLLDIVLNVLKGDH